MKKKMRKFNKAIYVGLIILIISAFNLTYLVNTTIHSDETDALADSGHSGGFTIISEKVEGQMDLLGALTGKIDITEGKIYGLTIIKRLETGEGQEPLIIKISSPGPIPVQNLKAETLGGTLPEFSGICVSETLGWLCLQDVKMTVATQNAGSILLPNANVETCFESQCGDLPDAEGITSEEIENALNELTDEQDIIEELYKTIEKDTLTLEKLKELLDKLDAVYNSIVQNEEITNIEKIVEEISSIIQLESISDEQKQQLITFIDKLNKDFENVTHNIDDLQQLMDDIQTLIDELEASIKETEEAIAVYEINEKDNIAIINQAKLYQQLIESVELETSHDLQMQRDPDEETEEIMKHFFEDSVHLDQDEIGDMETVKEELGRIKDSFTQSKEKFISLKEQVNDLITKKDDLLRKVQELKDRLIPILQEVSGNDPPSGENDDSTTDDDTDQQDDDGNHDDEADTDEDSTDHETDTDTTNEENINDDDSDEEEDDSEQEDDGEDSGNLLRDLLGWLLGL
jgi:hypothetical protein